MCNYIKRVQADQVAVIIYLSFSPQCIGFIKAIKDYVLLYLVKSRLIKMKNGSLNHRVNDTHAQITFVSFCDVE